DSHLHLVPIGAVGKIYIGGIGVSRGYITQPNLNAEKFFDNPFTGQGKLYYTGDLGRWLPTGQVDCLGRIDNQIKIRGFRVELDEIDSNILHYPQIRACVTVLQKNNSSDDILVSYIVPEFIGPFQVPGNMVSGIPVIISDDMCLGGDFVGLGSKIKEHLKQVLPRYSVPSIFILLTHLPMNSNQKVDKSALPWHQEVLITKKLGPDGLVTGDNGTATDEPNLIANYSPTQASLCKIWQQVLGEDSVIPLHSNFFNLGGHSILATRMTIQVQNIFGASIPHNLVFRQPTIYGMALEIDHTLDLNFDNHPTTYSMDFDDLVHQLPPLLKDHSDNWLTIFPDEAWPGDAPVFFLTGATGFLGTFILATLLSHYPSATVHCLVRAQSSKQAFERIKTSCMGRLVWQSNQQVRAIVGDLAQPHLGIAEAEWVSLTRVVDVIIHNGALVHWMYPYEKFRGPNVLGTLAALELATTHHIKSLHYISTLSVFTKDNLTQSILDTGIPESDDLERSRFNISAGYDQSKWVADKLIQEAHIRGYPCTIIRPGFIVGASESGVVNTDDFLWRLVKGSIQLGKAPIMDCTVNMCPVDYVAEILVRIVSEPKALTTGTFHVNAPAPFSYNDVFDQLRVYGFTLEIIDYPIWCKHLKAAAQKPDDNALYSLLMFVLDNLPEMMNFPTIN
ncbi:male sterility protein-domain-containing protein, partial [Dimargaris cristalligena]